jgi:hypothetical protein
MVSLYQSLQFVVGEFLRERTERNRRAAGRQAVRQAAKVLPVVFAELRGALVADTKARLADVE